MDLFGYMEKVVALSKSNPVVAAVVVVILLVFMVRRPKLFISLLALSLFLGLILFAILEMAGAGGGAKSRLIEKGTTQELK